MSKMLTALAAIAVTAVVALPTLAGAAERAEGARRNDRVVVKRHVLVPQDRDQAYGYQPGYNSYGYQPGYDSYGARWNDVDAQARGVVTSHSTFGFGG